MVDMLLCLSSLSENDTRKLGPICFLSEWVETSLQKPKNLDKLWSDFDNSVSKLLTVKKSIV